MGAVSVSLRKIVESGTPIPGTEQCLASFDGTCLRSGRVVFRATSNTGKPGIYVMRDGELATVADTSTPIPDGNGAFTAFDGDPVAEPGHVVFRGRGILNQSGVYVAEPKLRTVVNTRSTVPKGQGRFVGFGGLAVERGAVYFCGQGQFNQAGIYTDKPNLHAVVDFGTLLPAEVERFGAFDQPVVRGGELTFVGRSAEIQGVFAFAEGKLRTVASSNTMAPGKAAKFSSFGKVTNGQGKVAFTAHCANNSRGVFMEPLGLEWVVDDKTAIPNGNGSFEGFRGVLLSNRRLVFLGEGKDGHHGIYLAAGGAISKIIDVANTIDGKKPACLSLQGEFDGRDFLIRAGFEDGSQGVYVVTLEFPDQAPTATEPVRPAEKARVPLTLLDAFEPGQTIALKDVDGRYDVTINPPEEPGQLHVESIADDFVVAVQGNLELRIPQRSIRSILTFRPGAEP